MADVPALRPFPSSAVPFPFFVSLIHAIAAIPPRTVSKNMPSSAKDASSPALRTFQNWIAELHRRCAHIPPGTTGVLFRLLFPEEDARRKYSIKEARLAQLLADILAVSTFPNGRGERLLKWKCENASGCLGKEVQAVMEASSVVTDDSMSMADVDDRLTYLASTSAYSASMIHQAAAGNPRLGRQQVLRSLYTTLSPEEASVVTQIILKDLKPLLYPITQDQTHYAAALLNFNSHATHLLSKWDAMKAWDPSGRMLTAYRVRACLDEAAKMFEHVSVNEDDGLALFKPQIGIPVQIPKCVKGKGCAEALHVLRSSRTLWAETKYDGERAQIHVELDSENTTNGSRITIFSKSGRDSTLDRSAVHPIIRRALGFPEGESLPTRSDEHPTKVKKNIILEAEMVAFSDRNGIDEFWRIRSLITSSAVGVRHAKTQAPHAYEAEDELNSQSSLISNGSDEGTRHLALVFFDVLFLDDTPLLSTPYSARRSLLESIIRVDPGYAMFSERMCISLLPSSGAHPDAAEQLRQLFSRTIADYEEGLVLKADESRYNEKRFPWVKLKKDYIPGLGDTLDLVLVGASWEKERARELQVPTSAYTTFYLGALSNGEVIKTKPTTPPHFEVFFTACYGLTREQLEELNFLIKSADPIEFSKHPRGLSYTCSLFRGIPPPAVLLRQPVLAEVFGASFTKAPQSLLYEIRFPRISKVYRPSERSWADGTPLETFQRIAREAVGRDRPDKDVDDWCNALWGKPSSPSVRSSVKRKRTEDDWALRLARVDQDENGRQARRSAREVRAGDSPVRPSRSRKGKEKDDPSAGPSGLPAAGTPGSMTNLAGPSGSGQLNLVAKLPGRSGLPNEEPFAGDAPDLEEYDDMHLDSESPRIQGRHDTGLSDYPVLGQDAKRPRAEAPCLLPSAMPAAEHVGPPCSRSTHEERPDIPAASVDQFISSSVFWLARPCDAPRPLRRTPSYKAIPVGQQVHGLEAFLRACGWGSSAEAPEGCAWAERGVVFVDGGGGGSDAIAWMDHPLRKLVERRRSLISGGDVSRCKPVWVLGMKMLSVDELRRPIEDIEARVICKLG